MAFLFSSYGCIELRPFHSLDKIVFFFKRPIWCNDSTTMISSSSSRIFHREKEPQVYWENEVIEEENKRRESISETLVAALHITAVNLFALPLILYRSRYNNDCLSLPLLLLPQCLSKAEPPFVREEGLIKEFFLDDTLHWR